MNTAARSSIGQALALLSACLVLVVSGCATGRVDWAAQVGVLKYDQAVLSLGPPDKEATLQDGTTVAEWLTRRGGRESYVSAGYGGWYPYGYYYGVRPIYTETYVPDYFLRLTFDTNRTLTAWKKYAR